MARCLALPGVRRRSGHDGAIGVPHGSTRSARSSHGVPPMSANRISASLVSSYREVTLVPGRTSTSERSGRGTWDGTTRAAGDFTLPRSAKARGARPSATLRAAPAGADPRHRRRRRHHAGLRPRHERHGRLRLASAASDGRSTRVAAGHRPARHPRAGPVEAASRSPSARPSWPAWPRPASSSGGGVLVVDRSSARPCGCAGSPPPPCLAFALPRRLALAATARGWRSTASPGPHGPADARRRHRRAGDGDRPHRRGPSRGRVAGRRDRRLARRGRGRRPGRPVARRARRRSQAVARRQPGDRIIVSSSDIAPATARRPDPGRARRRRRGRSSTPACPASTPPASPSRRSPTRPSCTSSRPRRRRRPGPSSGLFDIVVAGAMLLVASPVLAVVAILVKQEDRGPVFFRQQRVGRGDAEFGMLKFRTMASTPRPGWPPCRPTTSAPARCSSWPVTPGSPRSATSCAARASTSCRSCSTS